MNKRAYRVEMLQMLERIPKQKRLRAEAALVAATLQHPFWLDAKAVALTIPKYPEINILPLIEAAWEKGKVVVIPKCNTQTKQLSFYQIEHFHQLEMGRFGIQEPIVSETKAIPLGFIDCIVVPGIAFNQSKQRLGFGGGYYDRLLTHYSGHTLALAFEEQIRDDLPVEVHDLSVQQIITEQGLINGTIDSKEDELV